MYSSDKGMEQRKTSFPSFYSLGIPSVIFMKIEFLSGRSLHHILNTRIIGFSLILLAVFRSNIEKCKDYQGKREK